MTMQESLELKCEEISVSSFVEYVWEFYNENNGIYPIKNLTKEVILTALSIHLIKLGQVVDCEFMGDSIDRERVKDIICELSPSYRH